MVHVVFNFSQLSRLVGQYTQHGRRPPLGITASNSDLFSAIHERSSSQE